MGSCFTHLTSGRNLDWRLSTAAIDFDIGVLRCHKVSVSNFQSID